MRTIIATLASVLITAALPGLAQPAPKYAAKTPQAIKTPDRIGEYLKTLEKHPSPRAVNMTQFGR